MTREELISKGKHKVRGNSDLMRIYISLYTEQFGKSPNCAGCTFDSDWQKFVSLKGGNHVVHTLKNIDMEKTFKLKRNSSDIISYKKDKKTHHGYANKVNDSFMVEYLTNGTAEQIEQRKKLFSVLPAALTEPVVEEKPKAKRTKKK